MKVLYILSTSFFDGATLSIFSLMDGVIKNGHEVCVVVPNSNELWEETLNQKKIKQYVVPMEFMSYPSFFGIKRLIGYPYVIARKLYNRNKSIKKILGIISNEKPSIVHTNVSPLDVGHCAARKSGIPHIWHVREYCDKDFNIHLFPSKASYRRKIREDYSICITKDLQLYNSLYNTKKSTVIYNGVRDKSDCHFITPKKKYFLCASRVSPEKGILRTIKVFAQFSRNHPDFSLIILGDGFDYYVDKCKNLSINLGISEKVFFKGFQQDVDSYMREATALLVASPFEGFGRMTAEASFAGCLVIGSNTAGTKEILEETGGYLWNNDEEYCSAMDSVTKLSDEDYSSRIAYAQKRAVELYSRESYVSQILKIYDSILLNNAKQ